MVKWLLRKTGNNVFENDSKIINYNLESPSKDEKMLSEMVIKGWVLTRGAKEVQIIIEGQHITETYHCNVRREDVEKFFLRDFAVNPNCGFQIKWPYYGTFKVFAMIEDEKKLMAIIDIVQKQNSSFYLKELKTYSNTSAWGNRSIKGILKNAIRKFYERIPLSDKYKAYLKNVFFSVFGFLLKRTEVYQDWKDATSSDRFIPADIIAAQNKPVKYEREEYVKFINELYENSFMKSDEFVADKPETRILLTKDDIKLIAFYLPQFHTIPENDKWWGKGFTEWSNVTKAVPQFRGHHQPQLPIDVGFYDLTNPSILKRQIELAKKYGLYGFCFHYYWFGGKRLLEKPLKNFLSSPDIFDYPFCLCWANENWTRRWDGLDSEVLISQKHSPEDDIAMAIDLEQYIKDKRYIKVDGKPLLIIYRPQLLPTPGETVNRLRNHFREKGIGEVFLVGALTFGMKDPVCHGFDAAIEFPPHTINAPDIKNRINIMNPYFKGKVFDFKCYINNKVHLKTGQCPTFKTVFPGWDNTARKKNNGHIFYGTNPGIYQKWLEDVIKFTRNNNGNHMQYVFINSWNEWAEGAHLEPDRKYGYGYLKATASALLNSRDNKKIVSIIMPAYNHANYIEECIKSVANQNYPAKELVIIDDCSQDNTVEVINQLTNSDMIKKEFSEGIKLLCHEENKGAHHTINEGISIAKGDYIAIINTDDLYGIERLNRIINQMELEKAQIAFSRIKTIDKNGMIVTNEDSKSYKKIQDDILTYPSMHLALVKQNVAISTGNMVFTKSLFEKLKGFNSYSYIHDWDFILRACLITEPIYVSDVDYFYRLHSDNAFIELSKDTVFTNNEVSSVLTNFFTNIVNDKYSNENICTKGLENAIINNYSNQFITEIWAQCKDIR